MLWRVVATCVCIGILSGCKNEPYEEKPLGVVTFLNHGTNITNTYRYRDQRIYTFTSTNGTGTVLQSMKFVYVRDQLSRIVSDSSAANNYKETLLFRTEPLREVDSTFRIASGVRSFMATRTVQRNAEQQPVVVTQRTVSETGITEQTAELTWEDANVTRLVLYNVIGESRTKLSEAVIGHDDQNCVYTSNMDYLYTLSLPELYWLSGNNPNVFNYGAGDKKYTYWYNKMGYPSNFTTDTNVLFGVSYTQIR